MKRFLSILLTVALISTSFIFTNTNTVKAADTGTVLNKVHFVHYGDKNEAKAAKLVTLSDGRSIYFDSPILLLEDGVKKFHVAGEPFLSYTLNNYVKLMDDGRLLLSTNKGINYTQVADDVVDYAPLTYKNSNYVAGTYYKLAHYILKKDGKVYAWSTTTDTGKDGWLAIGQKAEKATPTVVVDPETIDDPLLGVKKIIQFDNSNLLLITDNKVYGVGDMILGHSSLTTAKPVDLTSYFPSFTSADSVEMGFFNNEGYLNRSNDLTNNPYSSINNDAARRYFKIEGNYYTLFDTNSKITYVQGSYINDRESTTFYPLYVHDRFAMAYSYFSSYDSVLKRYNVYNWDTYLDLDGTDLYYWGAPAAYRQKSGSALVAPIQQRDIPFNSTRVKLSDRVVDFALGDNLIWVLRDNGFVYAIGQNSNTETGIAGPLLTLTKVTGPSNQLENIVQIVTRGTDLFALDQDGIIWILSATGSVSKASSPGFTYILPMIDNPNFAVGVDGFLYQVNSNGNTYKVSPNISGISAPSYNNTKPATPTHTISTDKFNNTVVTLDYNGATVKEYSLDGGTTWLTYTGPVTIPTVGNSVFQARAGNGTTYSDILTVNITSNPLTIPAGYPTLTESDGKVTIDNNIPGTKVQVSVDGGSFFDYTMPFPISDGSHSIEVVLINTGNGLEISRRTDTVTSTEGTETISTPTLSVANKVGSDFRRELTATYDSSQGDLMVSFDGGTTYVRFEDGNNYVANDNVSVLAKVVSSSGKESGVFTLYVTQIKPNLIPTSDGFYLDLSKFVLSSDIKVQYEFDGDATPFGYEYTGQVTDLAENTYTINLRFTNTTTNETLDLGSYPFTVTDTDDNSQLPPEVSDPLGDTEVELGVIGGGLSGQFKGVDLSVIQIDSLKDYQSIVSSSKAIIEDSRGTGEGWHYSLKITDFISDPVMDASTTQQDLRVKIPTNALSVNIKPSVKISGQDSQVGALGTKTFSTDEEYLAKADILQGMGSYEVPLDFTLTVPNKVEVVSVGGGSALTPGDTVGLRVGTYRSTFTFTLVSGI